MTDNEQSKKGKRKVALKNIASPLMTYAATYFANQENAYGVSGNSAMDLFKYQPALKSEDGSALITDSLLGSRVNGESLTGNINEKEIVYKASQAIQESFKNLTVKDVLELTKSEKKINPKYNGKYLSDLAISKDKNDQELFSELFTGLIGYYTDKNVAEALTLRTNAIQGGLEEKIAQA